MEKLVLDGKEFVKAASAAKNLGYTADYVGQLCRSGKVSAHLVGRSWYVNVDELGTHKVEKKRISRAKAREQAKKAIEESKARRLSVTTAPKKEVAITYEHDNADLIPETRKLDIQSEALTKKKTTTKKDTGPKYIVENEGNTIQMKGNLDVVDVTDGEVDTETVLLSPKIIPGDTTSIESEKEIISQDINTNPNDEIRAKTDFKDRLVEHGAIATTTTTTTDTQIEHTKEPTESRSVSDETVNSGLRGITIALLVVIVLIFSVVSVTLSGAMNYDRQQPNNMQSKIDLSIERTIEIIKLKI